MPDSAVFSFLNTSLVFIILEGNQNEEESYLDYAAVIDQLYTRVSVRYGNDLMTEGQICVAGKDRTLP